MRLCVTCVYQKTSTSVVVSFKWQKNRRRMYQVGLLSAFLCDSCIAGKSQQFFKLKGPWRRSNKIINALYVCVYCYIRIRCRLWLMKIKKYWFFFSFDDRLQFWLTSIISFASISSSAHPHARKQIFFFIVKNVIVMWMYILFVYILCVYL